MCPISGLWREYMPFRLLHRSGAVWESKWPSWAVRPNEPSGFHGRKDLLNRASAFVTTCPYYVNWHLRTLSNTSSSSSSFSSTPPPPPLRSLHCLRSSRPKYNVSTVNCLLGWNKIVFIHRNRKFNKRVQETQKQYACLSVTYCLLLLLLLLLWVFPYNST